MVERRPKVCSPPDQVVVLATTAARTSNNQYSGNHLSLTVRESILLSCRELRRIQAATAPARRACA